MSDELLKKANYRRGRWPYIPIYPADILADEKCSLMSATEFGAYCRLLFYQAREGSIPANQSDLAILARISPARNWKRVWSRIGPCFVPHPSDDTRLVQMRMYADTLERLRKRPSVCPLDAHDGRKSAKVRTKNSKRVQKNAVITYAYTNTDSITENPEDLLRNSLQFSLSDDKFPLTETLPAAGRSGGRGSGRRTKREPAEPEAFTRFYAQYPRKIDRRLALAEWKRLDPDAPTAELIIAGVEKWKQSELWRDGKIVYPQRFLKFRRWEADPPQGGMNGNDWKTEFLARQKAKRKAEDA